MKGHGNTSKDHMRRIEYELTENGDGNHETSPTNNSPGHDRDKLINDYNYEV